jgi:hypothetical protein
MSEEIKPLSMEYWRMECQRAYGRLNESSAEVERLKAELNEAFNEVEEWKKAYRGMVLSVLRGLGEPDDLLLPVTTQARVEDRISTLRADHAKLVAECAAVKVMAGHIASILKEKRESDDSTIHAGNTAFISMERWANEILSTPTGQELLEDKAIVDWLEKHMVHVQKDRSEEVPYVFSHYGNSDVKTLRERVRCARSREPNDITTWLNRQLLKELRKDARRLRRAGIKIPDWIFLK